MDDALGTRNSATDGIAERVGSKAASVPLAAQDLRVWSRGSSHEDVLEAIAAKLFNVYTRHRAELDGLAVENERLRALVPGPLQPTTAAGRQSAVAAADFVDLMTRVRNAVRKTRGRDLRKHLALLTDRLKAVDKDKRDLLDAMHRNRSARPSATETADSLRAMLDKERSKNDHLQAVVDEMFDAVAAHDHDRP